jgi:hypothetical protein
MRLWKRNLTAESDADFDARARQEAIEVLKWGDPQESLQFLRRHQDYRHIKRMVLELEGREREAATLR